MKRNGFSDETHSLGDRSRFSRLRFATDSCAGVARPSSNRGGTIRIGAASLRLVLSACGYRNSGAVKPLRKSVSICAAGASVVACAVSVPFAHAQKNTEKPRQGWITLDYFDAYLEFEAEYRDAWVRTRDRNSFRRHRTQKNRDQLFEERIGLKLGGAIVDPRFITYSADLSFALTQAHFEEEIDGRDESDGDNGTLLQYDARINFFPGTRFSGSMYGLRQDDRINRRFQSTLNERRTAFGTSWVFSHETIPMEFSYDYSETDRTGNRELRDNEHFTESTLHYGLEWRISDYQRLKFSYEHAKIKQEYQGLDNAFETTRDLFLIEHELEFGDQHQHELRMLVHWQQESGDFARDLFEIGPQLTLRHGDNLQTIYKYQFNRERYEGLDIESQRVDFQLIHEMYTNLTTTFNAFAFYEDVEDDINTTQYGVSVDWQYNRRNRWGRFYANLALAYDTEEIDGENGVRIILDESATFRDPVSLILRNRDVITASIVVTDTSNRRIFRIGVDYLIFVNGNVTRLVRVRSGNIPDGATVLIDYQFRTPTDGQLDTMRVDLSLEQRFTNGWTPYYRFSYRNQEDDTSFGFASRADRTDHHRIGATYEHKRFTFGAEYEIFDDTIEPYDGFHLNGMVHILQQPDHNLDFSTRYSRLSFEGGFDDRDVTLIDIQLDHRWRLTEWLSTIERVTYRFEDNSIQGDTHGWDVTAGFEYAVGDLLGELTFEYDRLNLPGSDEEDFGIYFRIRREIPNVLGKW